MGELRLYALSIQEMRGIYGAPPANAEHLRRVVREAFTPPPNQAQPTGLLSKLGPIFKRAPNAPVVSPTQPTPTDVDVLLAGSYVPPERTGASWRVVETMVQQICWGSTRMPLTAQSLDELDFALARGGVASAVGLRHLLQSSTDFTLTPVQGLTVGWHRHDLAVAMAEAYQSALGEIGNTEQRDLTAALVAWLDAFPSWAQRASAVDRPRPDLLGFWAN